MIKLLQRLLAQFERRRSQEGYAWAAGELLSGRMTPEDVEFSCTNIYDYDNPFNEGALVAVVDWRNRHAIQ